MKLLKTNTELIEHMKSKGIHFQIVSEDVAADYLQKNNYYMKLAAYRENYDKKEDPNTQNKYKYINLDFAHLQRLSSIDSLLRRIILQMCLEIEHAIKTTLLKDVENNIKEDGYDIIRRFVTKYDKCCPNIQKHKSSEYCRELIDKYYPYFPIWVFVELISFGDMVKLYEFYNERYPKRISHCNLLYSIRDLRNASAHGNCLINKLKKGSNKPSAKIITFVSTIDGIGPSMRKTKLSNKFLYDFTTLLFIYNTIINDTGLKEIRFKELKDLSENIKCNNKIFFAKNECIKSAFLFCEKVIDTIALV